MAVVGRQVQIVATEDGVRRVEREVIVDPESGLAAEVEKITIAVDVGDGNIAIAQQERVQVLVTGTEPLGHRPQQRAITYKPSSGYGTTPSRPTSYQPYPGSTTYTGDSEINHCLHCIITLCCPWYIFVWICLCCCYGC